MKSSCHFSRQEKVNQEALSINIYDEIPSICFILDDALNILCINKFGSQQLGYLQEELFGLSIKSLSTPDDQEFYIQKLHHCLSNIDDINRFESVRQRKDGSTFWVRDTVRIITTKDGFIRILILSEDITETRYLINELTRQSRIDSLTGLFNRRQFDRLLEQAILNTTINDNTHVLCFVDLDHFKEINDSCGHQAGDEVLRKIAVLLREQIRNSDIVARLGGDEFALILDSCNIAQAEKICNKIITSLNKYSFTWGEGIYSIGASIGLRLIDNTPGIKTSTLLAEVDSACYLAKSSGKNCVKIYGESSVKH